MNKTIIPIVISSILFAACRYEAGVAHQDDAACGQDAIRLDSGDCVVPGIPAELCAVGFTPMRGFSCEPVLPIGLCPDGTMAVPGQPECAPVAPCPDDEYGASPDDLDVHYVNQDTACVAQDSDCGSLERPWPTIQAAIDNAIDGSTVRIAAGTYVENVNVHHKAVHLQGRCPDLVHIIPASPSVATLTIGPLADLTEVSGISIAGSSIGVAIDDSDTLLKNLWVHDTLEGVIVVGSNGQSPSTVTINETLIENAQAWAIMGDGSDLIIQSSTIRGTSGDPGIGVALFPSFDTHRQSTASINASVIERTAGWGVAGFGSDVAIHGSVIRETTTHEIGHIPSAVLTAPYEDTSPGKMAITSSMVTNIQGIAVAAHGSELLLEGTVIRGTMIDMNHIAGGMAVGCAPSPTGITSTNTIRSCVIEQNQTSGISVFGTQASVISTRITDTLPADQSGDQGYGLTLSDKDERPAMVNVEGCVLARNHNAGAIVRDSELHISSSIIRDSRSEVDDVSYGDGVTILAVNTDSSLRMTSSHIEANFRAGISNFGGRVEVGSTSFMCNKFDLEGEDLMGREFSFQNLGNNSCGCAEQRHECRIDSVGLLPPTALD